MNNGPPNSATNSSITDGPHVERSPSIGDEYYVSSSSNASASSLNIGSPIIQRSPHHEQTNQGVSRNELSSVHAQKKLRLDTRQEDIIQPQFVSQLLQGKQNPQLNATIKMQKRRRHQKQQEMMPRAQQMPQHQPGPSNLQAKSVTTPVEDISGEGLCARRLVQYMCHLRHRPPDNPMMYWRKFVLHYFSPKAKKRWCFSQYENVGRQVLGASPQGAADAWKCGICGAKSGKGFETTYEILPRLTQVEFESGVVDELLFLEKPHEFRLSSGMMVLECIKAVQEIVYEQRRVIREGKLRVIFTPDLKILCWEFCSRGHEEFLSREAIMPKVNLLLQAAHKYQCAVSKKRTPGVPLALQASYNEAMSAVCQFLSNLELHPLDDLGFSKSYMRCLQTSQVVNSMKDLIDFSLENKIGPIEILKFYSQQAAANLQASKDARNAVHGLSNHATDNLPAAHIDNNTPYPAIKPNNYLYFHRTSPTHDSLLPQPDPFPTKSIFFNGSSTCHQTNNHEASQVNQNLQRHVIEQLLQESKNNKGESQRSLSVEPSSNHNNSSSSTGSFNTEKPGMQQDLQLTELDQDILQLIAEGNIQL
ncbi:uncharacterized protein A4U43_C04F30420 [Asparagus officinalis]|uniref:Uncharacterized protein n=1 Tax=Asparagus officinalis TaxID=4686 RepID=A0A5P1FA07_ASPOF|nr:probable transcriptional regulator SLK2 [Asparagus officinalis]ONK73360.1 uncharacterized protein A4U43_C04F30420 [Asparagus officinalis]